MAEPNITSSSAAHRIPKMAEVIAAELRTKILSKEFRPGDSLYSEASLMEQYDVSRPTLREALRLLEAQHLISVRRGSRRGPVVSLPDISVAAQSVAIQLQLRDATMADVYQFRAIFEPDAARLAAERATGEDIIELRHLIVEIEQAKPDYSEFARESWRFHRALVNIAGNATMSVVAETLHTISEEHARRSLAAWNDRAGQQNRAVKALQRLVDLIEQGDGLAAKEYWAAHMANVALRLVDDLSGTSITELAG